MADVGELMVGLKFDGNKLKSSMNAIEQQTTKGGAKAGKTWAGTWAVAAGNLIASGVKKIGGMISNTMGGAIARVDQLNNFPKVMQSLGYSANESKASVTAMSDALDGLPTTLDDLVGNVQMLSASMGNLNSGTVNATSVGIAFNNMMLAGGQGTEAASRAFTQFNQMLARGKVDMQSWNTLVEVAPGQMQQLAQSLLGAGASQQDLYKALQDGTVSMDDFNAAMVKLNEEGGEGFESFADQAVAATGGMATQIQNIHTSMTKVVSAALSNNQEDVAKYSKQVVERVLKIAPTLINGVVGAFDGILQMVPSLFNQLFPLVLKGIIDLGLVIIRNIGPIIDSIVKTIATYTPQIVQGAMALFMAIVTALPQIVTSIAQVLPGMITTIVGMLTQPSFLQMMLNAAIQLFMALVMAIPDIIVALAEAIPTIIDNMVTFISNPQNIMMILTAAVKVFMALVAAIPKVIPPLVRALGSLLSSMPRQIIGYAGALAGAFGQIMQKGVDKVKGFVGKMASAAGNLIKGLIKGIGNGTKAVINKIKEICSGALDAVKNFFGIKSPSRVMAQMGDYMMQGLSKGIDRSADGVVDSMNNVSQEIMASANADLGTGFDIGYSTDSTIERSILANVTADNFSGSAPVSNFTINMNNNINSKLDAQEIGQLMMTSIRRAS